MTRRGKAASFAVAVALGAVAARIGWQWAWSLAVEQAYGKRWEET